MRIDRCLPALLIAGWIAVACGTKSSPVPIAPTSPTPGSVTAVFPKTFTITGNGSLTTIGETSQLTVTAVFSDGTRKDVTNDVHWASADPSIATISSGGLLTAVGFGRTSIGFSSGPVPGGTYAGAPYPPGPLVVTITPAGTFVVWGGVSEAGHGPLSNVQVTEVLSRQTTMTNVEGLFSLAGVTSAHLRFTRDAYEPVETDLLPNVGASDVGVGRVPMQRIVRLTAGQAILPEPLHNNDVAYTMPGGQLCQPCRLIHVDVPSSGRLRLQLTWVTGLDLELWVNGQRFLRSNGRITEVDTETPVGAGEIVVYVGSTSANPGGGLPPNCGPEPCMSATSFTLASSLTE